jgi:endonuclease/exonuclease/phosphatase family metal-dependent hydrolase
VPWQAQQCTVNASVRVLTWNLFHGRAVPPAGRPLLREFAAALAGWEWDVALLQEVPPWWPPQLARAAGADHRLVLTSRTALLPLRRAIASRRPDLLKSNGGGANAILVRGEPVLDHRTRRLCRWPERRYAHGVRLPDGWVVNVHSSNRPPSKAWADDLRALAAARAWAGDEEGAGGSGLVFGGDLNLRHPAIHGLRHVAGNHVDHIFTDGRPAAGRAQVLDRGRLSDHPPVAVTLA